MSGTSFQHNKRGNMTPQRVLRIFQLRGGKCAGQCKRKLGPKDDYDVEHIIALENGGTDDDDNLQIMCEMCHALKTKDDHAQAAHGRGMAVRHQVPKKFRQSRGWGWR